MSFVIYFTILPQGAVAVEDIQLNNGYGPVVMDDDGNPEVGRPLRRPPPGWDARNMRNTVRLGLLAMCVVFEAIINA